MKFPKKKVWECLEVMKYVKIGILVTDTLPQIISEVLDIGILIPATLPQVILEVVDIGILRPATLHLVIAEDMLVEVDIGHKRPTTFLLVISEQDLMLKGEVYIGLIPATIHHITKVTVVYF